jgi:hypothetical protein
MNGNGITRLQPVVAVKWLLKHSQRKQKNRKREKEQLEKDGSSNI